MSLFSALLLLFLLFDPAPWAKGSNAPVVPAGPSGAWLWPVSGPVIRGFDPPESPYGAGHRGIDIAVLAGTTMIAPESGTVAFSGKVGGQLFITIDHGVGLESTYSWISSSVVRKGDVVMRGQPIGTTGIGHPGSVIPHLHFGVRFEGGYVDPLDLLGPMDVQDLIRLVPILAPADPAVPSGSSSAFAV